VKLRTIANAPFFSALSEQEQERVSERMHLEHRRSGETLFRKGADSTALYLLKSGWVRLMANGGPGLANQGPGSLVGETDLFQDQPRSYGAVTTSEAELWALSRDDLVDLISKDPQIGIRLSIAFGTRLALFDKYLVEQRLRALPLLAGLETQRLLAIARRLTPLKKKKDELIVEEGQPPEALFIVESGQVHLHSPDDGGDFSELGPGASFGELAVLTGKPHGRSAKAATDLLLWALPTAEFEALANEYPDIRLALSKTIREPLLARDQSRAVERLATMQLFAGLPEEVLWAITERLLLRHVPAGELVFAAGSPGDALYLVDSGLVEIVSEGGAGPIVLARLGADEFFGEMALLTGKPRSTAAQVAAHTNLWVLYRSDFEDLVSRYPSISLALSKVLSQRLAEADRRFTESHLRGLKLLVGLSPGQLEDVSRRLKPVRYRQGETIIREGDRGQELFFIESGRVRVVRGSGAKASLLGELGAGDLVGEMALLTGAPRSATVTAVSDLNLWSLSQADFDALVAAYPHLGLALSRLLSERLRHVDEQFLRGPTTAVAATAGLEPVAAPVPVRRPSAEAQAAPIITPRRKPARHLAAELRETFDGAVTWFGSLSRGAKVRLVLITILLAWLLLIVAPVLVISTLAAEDVTNLEGAIAFVQAEAPVPTEALPPTDAPISAAPLPVPAEQEAMTALESSAEAPADVPVEGLAGAPAEPLAATLSEAGVEGVVEATSLPPDAFASQPPSEPLPTATPWIIVITNTPVPATDTPVPTSTPIPPTAAPKAQSVTSAAAPAPVTPTPAEVPQPPRDLDPRLASLNVVIQPAGVRPGQSYWRLVAARWENEAEAGGGHSIFIDVLDENENKRVGQSVEIRWVGGGLSVLTEEKPANEYAANFPMYNTLGSYAVSVAGLPSDLVVGLGLGTAEQPKFKVHTNFFLTFKRVTR
jgi:CRP-like cAMP-binding protein